LLLAALLEARKMATAPFGKNSGIKICLIIQQFQRAFGKKPA
jgi:hypothetical protein